MNGYSFGFLIEPTTPPAIGDAATLETLCKMIGYLAFAPVPGVLTINSRPTITTGAYVPTNATAGNPELLLNFQSPYRLPSALMPTGVGATTSGQTMTAGAAIFAMTTALDDKCTTVITGLDRPVVTRGCGIVAYLPAGVDISDELDGQINIPVCNGQTLVIGTAVQDALDGVYQTPFSSAWAFGIFGGRTLQPTAVLPTTAGGFTSSPRIARR